MRVILSEILLELVEILDVFVLMAAVTDVKSVVPPPPPPPPPEPIAAVLLEILIEFWIVFVRASWAVNVKVVRLYMLLAALAELALMA